jgi:ribosomal protein S18 acetylase RimI-like enzyme
MTAAVRPVEEPDRDWLRAAVEEAWGSDRVVSRGRVTERVSELPGLVAERDGRRLGFALLRAEEGEMEVVALLSLEERQGAGTALLAAAREEARRAGCRRLWLVTTNDNLAALRFYQRCGWDWVGFHGDAVVEARRLKPEIPELGADGIPIRHELELADPGV